MDHQGVLRSAALALSVCSTLPGCDIVRGALGDEPSEEPRPAPSLSVSTKQTGKSEQVLVASEPRTLVQVFTAREDKSVRIYPPSAKRTDGEGKATFTVHSDHSVDVVATARTDGGETREELRLEIHTVPSIRIAAGGDGKGYESVSCEKKDLVAAGFRSGTLCANGKTSLRAKDRKLVFDVTVLGDEFSALRIGGQPIETGDDPTRVELEWLSKVGTTGLRDKFVGIGVELAVPNAGTIAAPLSLSWSGLLPAMKDAVRSKGLRFDDDKEPAGTPTLFLANPLQVHGPGTTLADVDYVAFTDLEARVVERCRYSGGKVVERRTTDATVTVYERRTGRKIASTTIRGAKPDKCSNAIVATAGDRFGGWKSREAQAWVAKLYDSKLAR